MRRDGTVCAYAGSDASATDPGADPQSDAGATDAGANTGANTKSDAKSDAQSDAGATNAGSDANLCRWQVSQGRHKRLRWVPVWQVPGPTGPNQLRTVPHGQVPGRQPTKCVQDVHDQHAHNWRAHLLCAGVSNVLNLL